NFDLTEVRFNSGLVAGSPPTPFVWSLDAHGNWNANGNWSGNVAPNAVGATARLMGKITQNRSIYSDIALTLGTLIVNNSVASYVIDGAGSMTFQVSSGTGSIDVQAGSHKINLPLTFASNTNINVAGGATLTIADPMTINASTTVTKTGNVVIQAPLTILSGG